MKFKDLKIGQKIIVGFSAISAIALIVGIIGLYGLRNVGKNFSDVAKDKLPSLILMKNVENEFLKLSVSVRTLLNPSLTTAERNEQMKSIEKNRAVYSDAIKVLENYSMTEEEKEMWNEFSEALISWRQVNDVFTSKIEKLNQLDINNPNVLLKNLERFEKDHYALQVKVTEAIRTGVPFEGGDDHTMCNLGKWIPSLETSNTIITTGIANMNEYHNRFHQAVHDAVEQIGKGNRLAAQEIYNSKMVPSALEVFKYFNILNEQAQVAVATFEEMERLQREEAGAKQELVQNIIAKLVQQKVKIANEEADNGFSVITTSNVMMILAILIGLVIAAFSGFAITRVITSGINKGVLLADKVAKGDLNVEVDDTLLEQKDEIGHLARSLQQMVEQLREIIRDVIAGADNISSASQEMSGTSQQLSQGASEQASSAEEISSSMEEMLANIQQNTDNAMQTEKIAVQAVEGIRKGSERTDVAVKSMKEIASKVSIIGDIAYQTNMLALNAAVEAARAGEHGKGFAVVAEEVRKLAERSQIAAEEIDVLSENGVQVAEAASKQLADIVPEIERTAKLVQEITAASMEQSSGADQVNNAIQQLNQVIQQNAAASEEMASSSEELSSQAEQMKDVVSYFDIENEKRSAKGNSLKKKKATVVRKQGGNGRLSQEKPQFKGVDFKLETVSDEDFQRF